MINKLRENWITCLFTILVLLSGTSCTNLNNNNVNQKLIKEYYTAYEKKDSVLLTSILADGFTFGSPVDVPNIDLKTYMKKCWPNAYNIKKFDIEKLIVDGNVGYATYNGWTTDGRLFRNTEYFKFKDGKIVENDCFFGPGVSYPNNTAK